MSSPAEPVAGPLAAEALARPGTGRVVAVFASVFYADMPAGLVCVARRGTAAGPLTLVTDAAEGTDWRARGLPAGAPVVLTRETLRAGPVSVDLAGLAPWRPAPWGPVEPGRLATALGALRSARPPTLEGLAGLLAAGAPPDTPVIRAASGPLAAARRWLAGTGDTTWAARLVGLGPGLTPSGDDLLGGMMLALHATAQGARAARLFAAIAPALPRATNPISAALIAAAARGLGAEPLHRAIDRLLANDSPTLALDDAASIGHSSGLDALAGAVAVLDAIALPARRAA